MEKLFDGLDELTFNLARGREVAVSEPAFYAGKWREAMLPSNTQTELRVYEFVSRAQDYQKKGKKISVAVEKTHNTQSYLVDVGAQAVACMRLSWREDGKYQASLAFAFGNRKKDIEVGSEERLLAKFYERPDSIEAPKKHDTRKTRRADLSISGGKHVGGNYRASHDAEPDTEDF